MQHHHHHRHRHHHHHHCYHHFSQKISSLTLLLLEAMEWWTAVTWGCTPLQLHVSDSKSYKFEIRS